MRIQHNIMAMNAYRNYNNNTSALSKNLEKLSSGYKINRAGDDAAGLAISEKMRAQITGLDQAQDNAQSGINLVQTAEGALQEVHDMLNRMVKLADQSANGTYDNTVDRKNLQDEVDQLMGEINRIADSANYNGIKLLDGSMSKPEFDITGTVGGAASAADFVTNSATGGKSTITVAAQGDGNEQTLKVQFFGADGKVQNVEVKYTAPTGTAGDNASAMVKALQQDSTLSSMFDITVNGANVEFTSKVKGEEGAKVVSMSSTHAASITTTTAAFTAGTDETVTITNGADTIAAGNKLTINGTVYEFVTDATKKTTTDGAVAVLVGGNDQASVDNLNKALESQGLIATKNNNNIVISAKENGQGLTLQIGDTSDDFNQLTVEIKDMHAAALGIADVSIATQDSAKAAVDVIKNAINTVSSMRGVLGATQNRLDHTINNLSVMQENIQDAESTIRDTDVADEMMAYTKNNILVQSAQAMLAQANQVPQGVLQLLQ